MKKWNLKESFDNIAVPEGRYKCVLLPIKEVLCSPYDYKTKRRIEGDKVPKLIFSFYPYEYPHKETENPNITVWCNPTNGKGGGLYKLLIQLSPQGKIEESVRKDKDLFQAFAESLVYKPYVVTASRGRNKDKNIISNVSPGDFTIPTQVLQKVKLWAALAAQREREKAATVVADTMAGDDIPFGSEQTDNIDPLQSLDFNPISLDDSEPNF